MAINNPLQAISKVRHEDKYKCVLMCIEKEKLGWECVRKIEYVSRFSKTFRREGNYMTFLGSDDNGYYEAIYRKRWDKS